jgi:hypothetical protein
MHCAVTSMMSHASQYSVARMLEDSEFVDSFIAENAVNLEAQATIVTEGLTGMGIPFIKPEVRPVRSQHRLPVFCSFVSWFPVALVDLLGSCKLNKRGLTNCHPLSFNLQHFISKHHTIGEHRKLLLIRSVDPLLHMCKDSRAAFWPY